MRACALLLLPCTLSVCLSLSACSKLLLVLQATVALGRVAFILGPFSLSCPSRLCCLLLLLRAGLPNATTTTHTQTDGQTGKASDILSGCCWLPPIAPSAPASAAPFSPSPKRRILLLKQPWQHCTQAHTHRAHCVSAWLGPCLARQRDGSDAPDDEDYDASRQIRPQWPGQPITAVALLAGLAAGRWRPDGPRLQLVGSRASWSHTATRHGPAPPSAARPATRHGPRNRAILAPH